MMATAGEPNQTIYDISDTAFTDAIEIRQLIVLLQIQNSGNVNGCLNRKSAGTAASIMRNALITRLVLLVSRVYDQSKYETDRNVGRAITLLADSAVKAEIASRGPPGSLDTTLDLWSKLKGDVRRERTKHFRDRYTAHIGEPNPNIPLPEFQELFAFARETTDLMWALARSTGARTQGIDAWDEELRESAEAFSAPWQ